LTDEEWADHLACLLGLEEEKQRKEEGDDGGNGVE